MGWRRLGSRQVSHKSHTHAPIFPICHNSFPLYTTADSIFVLQLGRIADRLRENREAARRRETRHVKKVVPPPHPHPHPHTPAHTLTSNKYSPPPSPHPQFVQEATKALDAQRGDKMTLWVDGAVTAAVETAVETAPAAAAAAPTSMAPAVGTCDASGEQGTPSADAMRPPLASLLIKRKGLLEELLGGGSSAECEEPSGQSLFR